MWPGIFGIPYSLHISVGALVFHLPYTTVANRSFVEMTEYIGTEWDYVMDSLLAQIEDSNMRKFVYEDEFSTMESIIEHSSDSLK